MIFLTFDPYNDLINEENKHFRECFICFENMYENNLTIRLNSHILYLKYCKCDSWVHDYCLKQWYNINNNCPICRSRIYKSNNYCISILINSIKYNTRFVSIIYIIYSSTWICLMTIFLYFLIFLYTYCFNL